jgi:hypothetical protein
MGGVSLRAIVVVSGTMLVAAAAAGLGLLASPASPR